MTNRELYFRDPTTLELLNNGVSKVSEIGVSASGKDERQISTLRFELETFVCDGEYARRQNHHSLLSRRPRRSAEGPFGLIRRPLDTNGNTKSIMVV